MSGYTFCKNTLAGICFMSETRLRNQSAFLGGLATAAKKPEINFHYGITPLHRQY